MYLKVPFLFNVFIECLKRNGEGKREKHRSPDPYMPATGDRARNPGMCRDWKSNWGPLAASDGAQPRVTPARP